MNTSSSSLVPTEVTVDDALLRVRFHDGTETTTSVARFPRLLHATPEQRSVWEVIGKGDGIHWPEIDEDISVRTLRGQPPNDTASSARVKEVLQLTGEIYKAAQRLSQLSEKRFNFTPDGHFVSAVGKVIAEYVYDLTLLPPDSRYADAKTKTGETVQIMLAGPKASRFGIRWSQPMRKSHAAFLLCLRFSTAGFEEIYNGPFPVEILSARQAAESGQVQISAKRLLEENPASLAKTHSFASINRFLPSDLADVA